MHARFFMIVGGGLGQLPALTAVRELGWRSLVIDRDINAPGMALADVAIQIDVTDAAGAVRAARIHNVCGAMTLQSDIGVPTVGTVVDALGLPGNGRVVADRCSNKIMTREYLAAAGVPQPDFRVVTSEQEALRACQDIGWPCIVKAPDSSGSRGVVKVRAEQEVSAAFAEARKYTRGNRLLVEEHIAGHELGAQAFCLDGRCEMVLPHNDAMSNPPYMIPIGHSFPCSLDAARITEFEAAVKGCVKALEISCGPSNIDIIIDGNGHPRIIEVGARMGATCLPELVRHFTGIDWVRASVEAAVGRTPDLIPSRVQPCAAYILESPQDGVLKEVVVPDSVRAHPDLLEFELTVKPGDTLSTLRKGTDRIGKIVVKGATTEEADVSARMLRSQVRFVFE